ncbi:DUF3575 domain-containing protein [bacterium]|nr:DUF3575 domain-containing protein [bacterium]
MKKRYLILLVFLALFTGMETSLYAQLIPSELRKEDKFKTTRPSSFRASKPSRDKKASAATSPTASPTPPTNKPAASTSKGKKKGKAPKKEKEKNVAESPQNVIRLNLTTLALSNLDLGFERAISPKFTVGLSGSYLLTSVFSTTSLSGVGPSENTTVTFDLSNFSGYRATPSFRYYPGGKRNAPHGFYVELFGRYYSYTLDLPYNSVNVMDPAANDIKSDGKFTLSGLGGGLSFGAQWIIGNRFTLDWNFIGGGTSIATITGEFTNEEGLTQDEYNQVASDVEDYYTGFPLFPADDTTITVEADQVDIKSTGAMLPLIRSNITIGFAF